MHFTLQLTKSLWTPDLDLPKTHPSAEVIWIIQHSNVYPVVLLVSVPLLSNLVDLGESWLDGDFVIQTQDFILDIQSVLPLIVLF